MDGIPEEVHDTKVETAEEAWKFWAKKTEKTEKVEKPEQEEKTFEETMEFWKEKAKKAEQAEISIEQELKAEDDTFEETKKLDKFYGFEQADLAEYEADLEAELKAGKSEEKIWQTTKDTYNPFP